MNVSVPGDAKVIVVWRSAPAEMLISVGRALWTGSVPVRWRSWSAAQFDRFDWLEPGPREDECTVQNAS